MRGEAAQMNKDSPLDELTSHMAELTMMLRKHDSAQASNAPPARVSGYGERELVCGYCGKSGNDDSRCYKKRRESKRCGYCGWNGHDEDYGYWAKGRDEQRMRELGRRQRPQEEGSGGGDE